MTTNDYFDSEMRVLTPDKALDPRSFALCWDTPDPEERRRRDKKLYALATGPKGTGFGIELETFKAVWYACRDAWKEDPVGFIERYVETGSWFSAQALMAEQLPELCYLVEGFLPQGLVLLASPPKYGKSWLALQLCLAVSRGEPFLGMPARQATCPSTVASAVPKPTGPRRWVSSQRSSSTSPGRTCRLKRAFFTPPKRAIFPRFSASLRMATAPTWARASRISTPGITWYSGKWPQKKGSPTVTHLRPWAHLPGSPAVIRSTSRKG